MDPFERAVFLTLPLRNWAQRYRVQLTLTAFLVFLGGLWLSVSSLGLTWSNLNYSSLLLLVVPCMIGNVLNGIELQLCAFAARARIGLGHAVATSSLATIANLLPLPAGAILRGAGMVRGGATAANAAGVLAMAAIMWLGMAIAITACALATVNRVWLGVAGVATIVTLLVAYAIARRSSVRLALGFLAVRGGLLGLTVFRLWLALAAVREPSTLAGAAYYAVAGLAGSVVMIIPAGLGVSEALAASMASAAGASPAAAFLALGISRIAGLSIAGIFATFAVVFRRVREPVETFACE